MLRAGLAIVLAVIVGAMTPLAAAAQDARTVVANAMKAMGSETLSSIKMWGAGATFNVGQSNNANYQWPRSNLNDYVRAIDFTAPATRATAVTWIAPVTGGNAVQGAYQQNATPANTGWANHLEIWTTPWGFLRGAAQNNATVATRTIGGRRFSVVTWNTPQKAPSGISYKVVGYINPQGIVERTETWVENPVLGDMHVENIFSDWRDSYGLKWPSYIVQRRAGASTFEAQILGVQANPADIRAAVTPPAPAGGPPGGGGPPAAAGPTSERLAPGVWRINGAYNGMAVEFKDYVVLFEPGPQNEARGLALIAETRRVIPGKPIRYGVISHHHFDHTGGIAAPVGEGITLVTPAVNKAFLERALSTPRTLAPDHISKNNKKPIVEGFPGVLRVFDDGNQRLELHVIQGLPHADGMVVGWLPKEKILVYADMFNFPSAAQPVPNPPVVGTQVFLANLERLKIEPERILSVHTMNPDRLATMADIRNSLGIK